MVALRKESVDRNAAGRKSAAAPLVALRKESVDRNLGGGVFRQLRVVALRKESVDRNKVHEHNHTIECLSLSARRAWIEIP